MQSDSDATRDNFGSRSSYGMREKQRVKCILPLLKNLTGSSKLGSYVKIPYIITLYIRFPIADMICFWTWNNSLKYYF